MFPRFFSVVLVLLVLAGCATRPPGPGDPATQSQSGTTSSPQPALSEAQRYFLEIALGSEYGNADPLLRRWEKPVRLYLDGDQPAAMVREAHAIVDEIRALAPALDVRWVDSPKGANVTVFLGPYLRYADKHAPDSLRHLKRNWGFFTVRWLADHRGIESASMYVDTHRARDDDQRQHLLREELTQLFGLMADSSRYPDSIFYQHWSTTTQYSELDRQLIALLYDARLHSGMDEAAIRTVWGDGDAGAGRTDTAPGEPQPGLER